MARRLIDISVPLQNDVPADPPGGHPTIQYIDHQQGLPRMLQFFEGLKAEDLPDGQGWAVEQVQLSTHNGTHLDAPWHFHPTMNRGERSWTIDEVPLEWCLQPGVKLDFRHLPDGYVATAKDVENELKRIGHTLSPLEIVVVNTSAGAKYGRQDYVTSGCGMGYEATMYLLERGVRLTGIDGWSWDAPFIYTAKKYAETRDASLIWEGHKAGRHIGYCHIEKLHNLEQLPSTRAVSSTGEARCFSGQDRTDLASPRGDGRAGPRASAWPSSRREIQVRAHEVPSAATQLMPLPDWSSQRWSGIRSNI
jgi:kynurenine formamidase